MAQGDHIYCNIYQNGKSLYHHGIDCGNDTVIHYQKNYKQEKDGIILWVSMTEFAKNRKIYIKKYEQCDPPIVVFLRAKRRLGEKNYNIFYNNCEHFAHYCKTGEPSSPQVDNAKKIIGDNGIAVADNVIKSVQSAADQSKKYIHNIHKNIEDTLNFWKNKDDDDSDNGFFTLL
ncbi:MAG: lecithin retinol acyltransferase family protein [Nostoc sp. DedSLP03]|uniref:lecithin retinol acyltransferase family protein n=1 Tax=Nostoc sp. DedSLP03 TaxID=3075400 RepID=UPI002AD2F545|nr:lecithin retinol acyltransferase family protein [Nostoc sp. DedSLP03]MDZ7966060.1 lecithin retinol acyltransferase family protein [Nostoc sp. DedSLP03]